MRSDGHSALKNKEVKRVSAGSFTFVLGFLEHSDGSREFVMHAHTSTYSLSGVQPAQLLAEVGFSPFQGRCPFFDDRCLHRTIFRSPEPLWGREFEVQNVHLCFERFAKSAPRLMALRAEERDIVSAIGLDAPHRALLPSPPTFRVEPSEIPGWADEVKGDSLLDLESRAAALAQQIAERQRLLPLVYGSGETLENAVVAALTALGLQAQRTTPGFTVDILAKSPDESCRFGLEVTGLAGPIKKKSNKLTQVVQFEQMKEHEEKTVLLAATWNTTPPTERAAEVDFTDDAVAFLSNFPVLMMTGLDLLRLTTDVIEGRREAVDVVRNLFDAQGVFEIG